MSSPSNEEDLDAEIAAIRAEIRTLHRRKRFLTSSILASEPLRKRLLQQQHTTTTTLASPLIRAAESHSTQNHHRIAFSTTTFPFTDPAPDSDAPNLLGVRIDVCAWTGRFVEPYYILLKRVTGSDDGIRLRVHRHTIPAFIAMGELESAYLPVPPPEEEETSVSKKKKSPGQNLKALVREVRSELVAWQRRRDAVEYLREGLGLVGNGGDARKNMNMNMNPLGIVSLEATALEARYVRLEWEDGRVGRFKLSDSGVVVRAVVIGDQGRDKPVENAMTGGDGRVETMLERLGRLISTQAVESSP